jgi:hypothetical protein
VTVPGAGHMVLVEQPDADTAATTEFIREVDAAHRRRPGPSGRASTERVRERCTGAEATASRAFRCLRARVKQAHANNSMGSTVGAIGSPYSANCDQRRSATMCENAHSAECPRSAPRRVASSGVRHSAYLPGGSGLGARSHRVSTTCVGITASPPGRNNPSACEEPFPHNRPQIPQPAAQNPQGAACHGNTI